MSNLLPCKACKKDVKAGAKECPHCGQKNPTFTPKMAIVSTIAVALIIGFGLKACQTTPEEAAADHAKKTERECKDKISAQVASQNFIKQQLKSPSTADFPMQPNHAIYKENCLHLIESYVDSQNSFGATVRSQTSVTLQFDKATESWKLKNLVIK